MVFAPKNNSVLQGKKGKGGGYYLVRQPKTITFGQTIRIMEGPLAPVPWVSETSYAKCTKCENELTCGVGVVLKDVPDAMTKILGGTTLAGVLERMGNAVKAQKGVLNFHI